MPNISKSYYDKASCEDTSIKAHAKLEAGEAVKFNELAGIPQHEPFAGETAGQFLARTNDPTKWIYGSALRDEMFLHCPTMLPKFAHLARKAFMYYGGDHYNPHTIESKDELFMRCTIGNFMSYKVKNKVEYDWDLIEAFLTKIVSFSVRVNLPYDQKKIDQGFQGKYKSPFDNLETNKPH